MRLLLDTSVFLRIAFAPESVPTFFQSGIDNSEVVYLSAASAWEIAIKASIGKLTLPLPASEYVSSRLAQFNASVLPIELRHATAVESLPFHHRDPFDRLIIVQAQVEALTIATLDATFKRYDVNLLALAS